MPPADDPLKRELEAALVGLIEAVEGYRRERTAPAPSDTLAGSSLRARRASPSPAAPPGLPGEHARAPPRPLTPAQAARHALTRLTGFLRSLTTFRHRRR